MSFWLIELLLTMLPALLWVIIITVAVFKVVLVRHESIPFGWSEFWQEPSEGYDFGYVVLLTNAIVSSTMAWVFLWRGKPLPR